MTCVDPALARSAACGASRSVRSRSSASRRCIALARRPTAPRGTAWTRRCARGHTRRRSRCAPTALDRRRRSRPSFPPITSARPRSSNAADSVCRPTCCASNPGRAGWAPDGNVAYSKICTHAGCPVAQSIATQSYQLYCPCHRIGVRRARRGPADFDGPATRALPQLALDVDAQGYLVARGDYNEPVGPDSWWRTL